MREKWTATFLTKFSQCACFVWRRAIKYNGAISSEVSAFEGALAPSPLPKFKAFASAHIYTHTCASAVSPAELELIAPFWRDNLRAATRFTRRPKSRRHKLGHKINQPKRRPRPETDTYHWCGSEKVRDGCDRGFQEVSLRRQTQGNGGPVAATHQSWQPYWTAGCLLPFDQLESELLSFSSGFNCYLYNRVQ
jgi:hypothetical protein